MYLIKWFTWIFMQVLFLLYKDGPCDLFETSSYVVIYQMSCIFYEIKNYACDVWNEFMSKKAQNSHGIDGKGYSPV